MVPGNSIATAVAIGLRELQVKVLGWEICKLHKCWKPKVHEATQTDPKPRKPKYLD